QRALIVGVAGLAAGALGAFLDLDQFFRSWLVGFMLCLGLSLGSLALLMLQHMSGGQWGVVGRRVFEAASRTLPFVAIAFIPIVFGMQHLFQWSKPDVIATDHVVQMKAPYLNFRFFVIRAVVYFAIWLGCSAVLNKWSVQQDR